VIKQSVKDVYFSVIRVATRPVGAVASGWYRIRRPRSPVCLNLGCGDDYRRGMINVDGNVLRRPELWMDLRNPLPFLTCSVQFVYCCHTLEHLYPDEALRLLREIRRVLSRDHGILRIAVPSFEHALQIAEGRARSVWPRESRSQYAQAINYLFCDGQHRYGYSACSLAEVLSSAGFGHVTVLSASQAAEERIYFGHRVGAEVEGSLVVECRH
jgi:predicted SAM-dependent methyltransferase